MLKTDHGIKRVCVECEGRFFDLNHDPIVCPLCQAVFVPPVVKAKRVAGRGPSSWYRAK